MSERNSVISNLSARSGLSAKSRASMIDTAAEVAALKVKLKFADVEAAKRSELDKLETTKQLAIAEAKLDVFDSFEKNYGESTFLYSEGLNQCTSRASNENVHSVERLHRPPSHTENENLNIDEALHEPTEHAAKEMVHFDEGLHEPPKHAKNDILQFHENLNQTFDKRDLVDNYLKSLPEMRTPENIERSEGKVQGQASLPCKPFTSSRLDARANEFTPRFTPKSCMRGCEHEMSDIATMTKTFAEQLTLNRLPIPEPSVFHGDPLKYTMWKCAFETLIENRNIPPAERLFYLKKYVGGEVKEALEGYFLLTTDDAFHEAKQLLEDRYGNDFVVARAFREKLEQWPKINARDSQALRKYGDFLKQCLTAMNSVESLNVLNYEKENKNMASKLPDSVIPRWSRIIIKGKANMKFPKFREFVDFVMNEANVACETATGTFQATSFKKPARENMFYKDRDRKGAVSLSSETKPESCVSCGKGHDIERCESFLALSMDAKKDFVRKRGLCFGCLKWGHLSKDCPSRRKCDVCPKRHPTVFHGDIRNRTPIKPADSDQTKAKTGFTHVNGTNQNSKCAMIVPVWLSHIENPDAERLVYALLDTQSDTTFILKDTCDELGVSGPKVQLMLSTMHIENETIDCRKVKGLVVRGYQSDTRIPLPATYTRDIMPTNREHIPTRDLAEQIPCLSSIASEFTELKDCEVGILIGYNCPKALTPRDIIASDELYAVRTDLGWSIVGVLDESEAHDDDVFGTSHRLLTYSVPTELRSLHRKTNKAPDVTISLQTQVRETILPSHVLKLLELDFIDHESKDRIMSFEDKKFLKVIKNEIQQTSDNHYEMPLPFRDPDPKLPNNRKQADRRLQQLAHRFKSDPQFHSDYRKFMDNMIQKGHAEKVEPASDDMTVWYIPHHGVYHPKKPTKIRIVFDCSARFQEHSLNDWLLQGPDLTNALVGVLLRFRQERIAFSCDIEQMFYQFQVSEKHRDYLRFLWWENSDYTSKPTEYRMKVHLFGATSSPGCANYGLRQCASDHEAEVESSAADFLRNNFYVDDGLKSVPSVDEAVKLIQNSVELCAKGEIRLHKFASNSTEVMNSLSKEDCSQNIDTLNLVKDMVQVERPLGIQWCIQSDTLSVRVTLQDCPLTRRGILSTVSSVYDPLGFIAPVIMVGKVILQEMCRDGAEWDDPLPEILRPPWEKWRSEIFELSSLHVDRCYKPEEFGTVKTADIHHFSDASNSGYGQCSYLRLVDVNDKVNVAFLIGKSRVAPLKQVTIPRLELTAALLSVRISSLLSNELEIDIDKHVFWTDSRVVLGYISNEAKRFQMFVANRVSQIRDKTEPNQWKYIESERNPADDASRGLSAVTLMNKSDWLTGPQFLWNTNVEEELYETDGFEITQDDPELKRVRLLATHSEPNGFELERFEHISDWHRLKRVVAMCLNLKSKLKNQVLMRKDSMNCVVKSCTKITTNDLQSAEHEIVRLVQHSVFKEEIKTLRSLKSTDVNTGLKRTSKLSTLDPFMDKNDILRIGGRIRKSLVTCLERNPAVLPKGHVSMLLMRYCHERTFHQGRGITVNKIRSMGYWIIGCSRAVSSLIYKCVSCRKLRSQVMQQKMSDLPSERLNESPPFTYCGVDCFGPFMVKDGRKTLKRYGVLFTCLACRAIHVEVASSLSTDSFINALRRFQAIRGPIRELRCDRGTNFVGASNEFDLERVKDILLKDNCDFFDFKMNVPSASHMGGTWERQIRSVRAVFNALMNQASEQLDDESLRTLMLEATAIVNSRPLSIDNLNDPNSLEPLTANHLLTMKSQVILPPPGQFGRTDTYACKQWRRVQYYANEFWSRWKKEVLHNLQVRQKWLRPQRNVQIGDIVMVSNDNLPRNLWQIARVVETYPSADGRVRKVKLRVADPYLNSKGKRICAETFLERPIQKLVLLVESGEDSKES